MKIAITSSGNTLESKIDSRFGRCSYFVIFDTISFSTEFMPNPNKEYIEGAGLASVRMLASKGVDKVISGEFGSKVKSIFDQHKIQLIIPGDPGKMIYEIIDLFKSKH